MKEEDFNYPSGKHYDVLIKHQKRPMLQKDIPFYIEQAKRYRSRKILELGCGTGRITIPFKEVGFDIVGIDLMETMLAEAREKANKKSLEIPFIQSDMRNFDLTNQYGIFDLIFAPAAVFQALLSNHDFQKMLGCLKKHLNPNGRLIFHMFNPNLEILTSDPEELVERWQFPDPESDGTMKVFETLSYDASKQLTTTKIYYKVGSDVKFQRDLVLKMYYPCELDTLLEYGGFEIEHKFADFEKTPFNSHTNSQIAICKLIKN
jgi:SAM-dependent methyltransferase